ncbi:putative quinol monooxygenase [Microbacterium sp. JZ37]|uniref:putative quinol monooxygenase n=1 Tax=Microbacterium sp. JZ37 TaxID=2654193 RepID=UPI002B49D437|nr:putative quinol monooxygenase [Microbacterium sp. JZ37]WRH18732.1 antibiotic biosynthesis monooxygenase [Microbacterium sp. JZ37]
MSEPVVLHAEFTARPGSEDHVAQLITAYASVVRAESGNVVFDVYRRAEAPEHFFVFEVYRDRAAFDAHLGGDAGSAFNAELADHVTGGGSALRFLEPASVDGWRT